MTASLLHASSLNERRYALQAASDGVVTFAISPQHYAVRARWVRSLLGSLEAELPLLFREVSAAEAELRFDVQTISAEEWGAGSATRFSQTLGNGSLLWLSAKDTRQYGGVQDQLYLSKLILKGLGLSYPDGDTYSSLQTQATTLMSSNESPYGLFGHTFYPTSLDLDALKAIFGRRAAPVAGSRVEHFQTVDEQLMIGRNGVVDLFHLSLMGVDPLNPASITFDHLGRIFNDYRAASIAQFNPWEGDQIVISANLFQAGVQPITRFAQAYSSQEDQDLWLSDATIIYNDAGKLLLNVNGTQPGLGPSLLGINDYLAAFIDVVGLPNQALPPDAFLISQQITASGSQSQDVPVVRLFNQQRGIHLFSSFAEEIDLLTGLRGWTNEGVSYVSPSQATAHLYRFYVQGEDRHFYTASIVERDLIRSASQLQHFMYEGISHRVIPAGGDPSDATAVVRYLNLNTGSHLFSTSPAEQLILNQLTTWRFEGVAWYGM